MEPPSPTKPGSRPKRSLDTAESVAAMPGSSGGAIHPWAAASMSMVMCAPSSVRMAEMRASVATCASTSGGSRSENFSVVEGPQDVAAVARLGQPVGAGDLQGGAPGAGDEPVDRVGRRGGAGRRRSGAPLSGNSAAMATRLARCASGIPAPSNSGRRMRPVASSSICDRMRRRMRNEDGTTPPPCPLWMPSVSTSTFTVATRLPRSDEVNHRRS